MEKKVPAKSVGRDVTFVARTRAGAQVRGRPEELVLRLDLGREKKWWLCMFFVGYPPFFLTDFFSMDESKKQTVSWMFACIPSLPYWEQKLE